MAVPNKFHFIQRLYGCVLSKVQWANKGKFWVFLREFYYILSHQANFICYNFQTVNIWLSCWWSFPVNDPTVLMSTIYSNRMLKIKYASRAIFILFQYFKQLIFYLSVYITEIHDMKTKITVGNCAFLSSVKLVLTAGLSRRTSGICRA